MVVHLFVLYGLEEADRKPPKHSFGDQLAVAPRRRGGVYFVGRAARLIDNEVKSF